MLLQRTWAAAPAERPTFTELAGELALVMPTTPGAGSSSAPLVVDGVYVSPPEQAMSL